MNIRFYENWYAVIIDIIDAGVLPTNIIFEKASLSNQNIDQNDKLSKDMMDELYKKANELDDFMKQFKDAVPEEVN